MVALCNHRVKVISLPWRYILAWWYWLQILKWDVAFCRWNKAADLCVSLARKWKKKTRPPASMVWATHDKCDSMCSSARSCRLSNLSANAGGYFHHSWCIQNCHIMLPIILFIFFLNLRLHVHVATHVLERENWFFFFLFRFRDVKKMCTQWYDHAEYDYLPPCCLVQSNATLTAVMATETSDVICMWGLWMDEYEMRWACASGGGRGCALTWQKEACLGVQRESHAPECGQTYSGWGVSSACGLMKSFWCKLWSAYHSSIIFNCACFFFVTLCFSISPKFPYWQENCDMLVLRSL